MASLALIAGEHSLGMLYLGRFLAGVCSGAAFAAGTAWIKELSVAPYDRFAGEQAGARRAAIALSAGFGLGPLVAGLLAQWAPHPLLTAYLPHLAVMLTALVLLAGTPETIAPAAHGLVLGDLLRVPAAGHVRFRRIVAPSAPWVFAAPSIAFAVLPGLVAHRTGSFQVGFAALIAGVTLTLGVLIQPLARRLDRTDDLRGTIAGLGAVCAGVLLGALAAHQQSWPLVIPAAMLLGCGYGLCLVSGLLEIQRLANPQDLASLTAIYYALTYVGFAAPIVLAELTRLTSAPTPTPGHRRVTAPHHRHNPPRPSPILSRETRAARKARPLRTIAFVRRQAPAARSRWRRVRTVLVAMLRGRSHSSTSGSLESRCATFDAAAPGQSGHAGLGQHQQPELPLFRGATSPGLPIDPPCPRIGGHVPVPSRRVRRASPSRRVPAPHRRRPPW